MTSEVHRLTLPLSFPEGIHPGAGRDGNALDIARDGTGAAVLRGTALAGALRSALSRTRSEDEAQRWFGAACGDLERADPGLPSPLRVPDVMLDHGQGGEAAVRTHIGRDRHTGAQIDGSLYTLASCPPGTTGTAVLWLHDDDPGARELMQALVATVDAGLTLGGHAARGIGRARFRDRPRYRRFDLRTLEDHAAYLDEHRRWRAGEVPAGGEPIGPDVATERSRLRIDIELAVPRGQDLLVGDGIGFDVDVEPQRVRAADGKEHWRIPGSTLRGALRAWVTRLAAKAGQPVADSLERHEARRQRGEPLRGDDLSWGFVPPEERAASIDDPGRVACPVMRLFGSGYQKGRVHVADALAPAGREQLRRHVAVDRLTGGASDGLLFDNRVVPAKQRFAVTITVIDPSPEEAEWLVRSLQAIDMGLLRIGSSKSAGRLALARPPCATGPHAELFEAIQPREERDVG